MKPPWKLTKKSNFDIGKFMLMIFVDKHFLGYGMVFRILDFFLKRGWTSFALLLLLMVKWKIKWYELLMLQSKGCIGRIGECIQHSLTNAVENWTIQPRNIAIFSLLRTIIVYSECTFLPHWTNYLEMYCCFQVVSR